MKKLISTLFFGFISVVSADPSTVVTDVALGLAANSVANAVSELHTPVTIEDQPVTKPAFFYVRFAAAENDLTKMHSVLPGFGIGYRRLAGDGAADILISGIGYAEKKNNRLFWTAPKASYIHYLQPDQKQSFYAGGGLAWGGLDSRDQEFIGIIPSVTAGYEFVRKSTALCFTELNISQPAIAVYKEGAFPGPIAELTFGVGF